MSRSGLAVVLASDILRAFKTGSTSRGDSGTPSADPHLSLGVAIGTYIVETWLAYDATTTADILQTWVLSGGAAATMVWGANSLVSNASSNISATSRQQLTSLTSTNILGGVNTAANVEARPGGLLTVTTAGTFALSWSANTAGASGDAVLHAGSWMRLTKVA